MTRQSNVKLQQALLYVSELGVPVFPCHSVRNGTCTCGRPKCDKAGKHPRTLHGFRDATTDPTKIRGWWKNWPAANVAIATGNGLIVIDVDPRHGGDETFASLEAELGKLPRGFVVKTGGGGLHVYLSVPNCVQIKSKVKWRAGIDIRGEGGYVVAPPSDHLSGGSYKWESMQLPTVPAVPTKWMQALPTVQLSATKEITSTTGEGIDGVALRGTDTTDNTNFFASVSVTKDLSSETIQQITAAIELGSVKEPGTRHSKLFQLGSHLSRISELKDCFAEDVKWIVRKWYERSEPNMRTKQWEASWGEFLEIWSWAKQRDGATAVCRAYESANSEALPPIATRIAKDHGALTLGQLVAMCRYLQLYHSDENGVWYLSCRKAGDILGVSHKLAAKWLRQLVSEGILKCTEPHKAHSRKAQRYRYVGEDLNNDADPEVSNIESDNVGVSSTCNGAST